MTGFVDIGANLTHETFRRDLDLVIERAQQAGVQQFIVTGTSLAESAAAHALATVRPGLCHSTVGLHPHLASEWTPAIEQQMADLAEASEVVAIGEAGLDFNRNFSPRDAQERAFTAQLELAVEKQLPIFMHERDAHDAFMQILRRYRDKLPRAVIHCFTGTERELDAYLELDLHVGITGWICDERRGHHLRELVGRIPDNRLMIETDCPYLLPRDYRPKPKSRRNEPFYLPWIAATIAACRGESLENFREHTAATARAFFQIPAHNSVSQ